MGCGTGTNAVYLAQRGFTVTAIDLSPLAIAQAKTRAVQAGAAVEFLKADILQPHELGSPFPFVFDRGVYHHLRNVDLAKFVAVLARVTAPGGWYLTLAGNASDPNAGKGPPCVAAHELCLELSSAFDLVQLREFVFDGIVIDGKPFEHLAWSTLLRRKRTA
jgi:SAM-dependent methyltransferase